MAQKIADAVWLAEIDEIYRNYEMYHQSASNDQAVFDSVSGRPSGRCEVLVRRLLESGAIPRSGALLDVGAGSGAMLAAFSGASDEWKLYGLDLDARKEQALKAIPRFEQLYTVPPEQLSRQFDLVTLIHSLEHFADPVSMLRKLRGKVATGGRLFVEVVNVDKTPFDLVVADHLCHFTPRSLAFQVERAGLGVEVVKTDWINKEVSLLAVASPATSIAARNDPLQAIGRIEGDIAWLHNMLEHARASARGGQFGIFGTSVAATWLAAGLGDAVQFFVDEDPAREGCTHLSRHILKPDQLPRGATVYLAFAREASDAISRRLSHLPVTFLTF
jgi:2-polyprenyl-3-methyl-5-hydroxy-6-metoxy-1,4-benzoquinol methylase